MNLYIFTASILNNIISTHCPGFSQFNKVEKSKISYIFFQTFAYNLTVHSLQFSVNQTKCITVASTTSGMVHSVPVAHLAAPPRITGSTVHYYTSSTVPPTGQRTVHHLPQATVTIQNIPGTTSQVIRG